MREVDILDMSSPSDYKILIIDDDPFILDMYVLKFKETGFQVEIARDGKDGLQKIKTLKPDLVLLDIVMPQADGFEVLQSLNKEKLLGQVQVILLTNLGQKDDVERGLNLGAKDYIIKAHFTPSEVVEKVKNILNI